MESRGSLVRTRAWVFTLNNPTEGERDTLAELLKKESTYGIIGLEKGEKGTVHLQGYVKFKNPRAFAGVRKLLGGRAHVEAAKGDDASNYKYCSKEDNFVQWGTQSHKGARNDMQWVRETVKATNSIRQVIENATSLQSVRAAEVMIKYTEPGRTTKPTVFWYYGSTGTGKTRAACEEAGADVWWSGANLQWFDGYDGQKHAILDDFRGDQCTLAFLLRLLDRYPVRVPVKGGFRMWTPDRIWITTPYHPTNVYPSREDCQQLIRRIDTLRQFTELDVDRRDGPVDDTNTLVENSQDDD